ncbi:ABC transporter substrate-binding protein [Chitinimonas lacunae]|uniref:ABC transporter substrate-binding protein n=1 Tax=Chitinimonas lacunae TaxID=1963018 RepID=A0ABV8MNC0_9NEIS
MRLSTLLLLAFALPAVAKPLVVCTDADPDGFDPAQSANNATHGASASKIYNTLIDYEPGPFKFNPALAERWTISDDGRLYTFHLRRGVKFHTTDWFKPSRDFNADDVLFTLQRQLDPKHPGARGAPGGFPYALSGEWNNLFKRVEKVDDYTIRLELHRPFAPLLERFAHPALSIVSAEYASQLERANTPLAISSQPVGTGPYLLKKYDKGQAIRYEAHPNYFRGRLAIERLVLVPVSDASVRVQKLLAGECQLTDAIKPQDLPRVENHPKLSTTPQRSQASSFLFFNVSKKPFDDKRVRQALNLALDREAIVKTVYDQRAEVGSTPYSPRSLWGVEKVAATSQDLVRAKKLLAEAGYPNGTEVELWVRPGGSGTNPNFKLTAELIQADWAKIGVKTTLRVIDWTELVKRARAGEPPSMLSGWSGALDPDGFYSSLASCDATRNGYNFAQYCNNRLDAELDAGRLATTEAARTRRYLNVQNLLLDELPFATLAYPTQTVVFDRDLKGVEATVNDSYKVERLSWR